MTQSVKKYFQEEHEDKLYDAICDRLEEHPEELKRSFRKLHRMGALTLEEIEVISVYTERCSFDKLNFEIDVRATVSCNEEDYHYDDSRCAHPWYTVKGIGSLDNMLEDFRITKVTPYMERNKNSTRALRDTFVPNITKDNMDIVAEQVLNDFYPEALERPMPINTDVLLERLQLEKYERMLTANSSVFGRIYFEDDEVNCYNLEKGRGEILPVKAGTILVDPEVFFFRNIGSINNTIIHECVHWLFHRPLFVLEKISDSSLKQIDCAVGGGIRGRKWSVARTIEWQANALTPRIQMPAPTFCDKAADIAEKAMLEKNTESLLDVIETVIEQVAEFFEVSKLSAKIRMVELGCEEARGAFIYVDGHYVKPYGFKKGFLKENQTFSIGIDAALNECLVNGDLRDSHLRWRYAYIDSHFVRCTPKYVANVDGELVLTEYALRHMDECCLVFEMSVDSEYDSGYQTYCFLNRDKDGRVRLNIAYANGLENSNSEEAQAAAVDALLEEDERVLATLPRTYPEAMAKLYEDSGMTYKQIADELHIDRKTVQNVIKGVSGSYVTLAGILLSMQITPGVSDEVIRMSDWKRKPLDKQHRAIAFALDHLNQNRMSYILKFLHDRGVNF